MTIGEANAVNVLLEFLLEHPSGWRSALPAKAAQVEEAGALLAKGANKALMAGILEEGWRKNWRRRPKVKPETRRK